MSNIINAAQANKMLKSVLNEQSIKCYTFELYANYSNDLSSIYYGDFIEEWANKIIKKDDYIVLFASEAIKNAPYYKISHLRKMTKQAVFDLCVFYELIDDNRDTKDTLIREIMHHVDNEKYYTQHYEEARYYDLDYDFRVDGYCQGDVVKVKLVGSEKDFLKHSYLPSPEYLTNIFYDSPINGFIKVLRNGEPVENLDFNSSIAFHEVNDFNEYDYWDRDEFIEKVKKTEWINKLDFFDLLIEHLENALPASLEYDY